MNKILERFLELYKTIKKLRDPNGCEWDSCQTTKTLIPYLLEETYELIESIEKEEILGVKEELGDLFLHLIFQAQLYEENGFFKLEEIFKNTDIKLKSRHPEIFSKNNTEKKLNWEEKKQKEKKRKNYLDGVPISLPALTRASRIQEKAAQVGFDWQNIDLIWDKVYEEINELKDAINNKNEKKIESELGDVLFTIVNLARFLKIQPDSALKSTIYKFERRFQNIEIELKKQNKTLSEASLEEMDDIWNRTKKNI